jgi:hypothetical protein
MYLAFLVRQELCQQPRLGLRGPATTGGSAIAGRTRTGRRASRTTRRKRKRRLHAPAGRRRQWGTTAATRAPCPSASGPQDPAVARSAARMRTGPPGADDGGGTSDCALLHTDGTWRERAAARATAPYAAARSRRAGSPRAPRGRPVSHSSGLQPGATSNGTSTTTSHRRLSPSVGDLRSNQVDRVRSSPSRSAANPRRCRHRSGSPGGAGDEHRGVRGEVRGRQPQWDVLAYDASRRGNRPSSSSCGPPAASGPRGQGLPVRRRRQTTPDDTQSSVSGARRPARGALRPARRAGRAEPVAGAPNRGDSLRIARRAKWCSTTGSDLLMPHSY